MKLKHLTLENIASIEKAEIDFEKPPLSDSSLFLICGRTGSGKTTVLDAICLALYGETPRYHGQAKNAEMVGDWTFNDKRHIVRKGADRASSCLTFQGNDGVEYEATWSVELVTKGKNKGTLGKDKLVWNNLVTKESISQITKITPLFEPVTGFSFDQFCRTSLLAQGQFTKFLDASENEKIEILEKLTNTDRFKQIGISIYETADKKKALATELEMKLKEKTGMKPEERAEKEATKSDKGNEIQILEGEKKILEEKISWLTEKAKLVSKNKSAETELSCAKEALDTDEFRQHECNVKDWDTAQDKGVLDGYRQWKQAEKELRECERKHSILEADFLRLMRGKNAFDAQRITKKAQLDQVEKNLAKVNDKANLYDNAPVVLVALSDAQKALDAAKRFNDTETAHTNERPSFETAEAAAKVEKTAADGAVSSKDADISAKDDELTGLKLSEVRDESASLAERLANLRALKQSVESASQRESSILEDTNALTQKKDDLIAEEDLLPGLKAAWDEAQIAQRLEESKRDEQKKLIENGIQKVVSDLHKGDKCPICGKKIKKLHTEAYFADLFAQLEAAVKTAKSDTEVKESAYTHKNSMVLETRTNLSLEEQDIVRRTDELKKTKADNERQAQQLGLSDATVATICNAIDSASERHSTLAAVISKGADIEKSLKTLRSERQSLQATQTKCGDALAKAENALKDCKAAIQQATKDQERELDTAAKKIEEAKQYMTTPEWETEWRTSPDSFVASLRDKAEEYSSWKASKTSLLHSVETLDSQKDRVETTFSSLFSMEPSWEGLQTEESAPVDQLETALGNLSREVATLQERKSSASTQKKQGETTCLEFLSSNERFDEPRLAALFELNVMPIREIVNSATNRVASLEGGLDQARKDLENHEKNHPEGLTDADTEDKLQSQMTEKASRISSLQREITKYEAELEADDAIAEARAELQAELIKAEEDRDEWAPLDQLYGDKTGKKIQLVIQTYVLRNVLRKANECLKHLSHRYTLACRGLTLTVLDSHEGGTERPVNTLSGGEKFLAALALALGLAGMNEQGLSVDTLFVDEGFGSLSGEFLNMAMDALEKINTISGCRRVGVISHVEYLRERIATHIEVKKEGHEPSTITVVG